MTALRDSFGQALLALGAEHPDVVVLNADLASATKTSLFAKQFPERHFNCGIAEENMASIAAGLAAGGLSPFISGFAMFTAGRFHCAVLFPEPDHNLSICDQVHRMKGLLPDL